MMDLTIPSSTGGIENSENDFRLGLQPELEPDDASLGYASLGTEMSPPVSLQPIQGDTLDCGSDICALCHKIIYIHQGLILQFGQSFHSACFEKGKGSTSGSPAASPMEVSHYMNLDFGKDSDKADEIEPDRSHGLELEDLGFPSLGSLATVNRYPSLSNSSASASSPPVPVTTSATGDETKASSPRGASYIMSRVNKLRRKHPSKKETPETTNASSRPPKPGKSSSLSLPSSTSPNEISDTSAIERRRAASLSQAQGLTTLGAFLPYFPPPGFIGGVNEPIYQNFSSVNSSTAAKVAFQQRSNHRDYALVDYATHETAQNLAGMTLTSQLNHQGYGIVGRGQQLSNQMEEESDYYEMDFTPGNNLL